MDQPAKRRFNQFNQLYNELVRANSNKYTILPHLPTEDGDIRRELLEMYLKKLLSYSYILPYNKTTNYPACVNEFLMNNHYDSADKISKGSQIAKGAINYTVGAVMGMFKKPEVEDQSPNIERVKEQLSSVRKLVSTARNRVKICEGIIDDKHIKDLSALTLTIPKDTCLDSRFFFDYIRQSFFLNQNNVNSILTQAIMIPLKVIVELNPRIYWEIWKELSTLLRLLSETSLSSM